MAKQFLKSMMTPIYDDKEMRIPPLTPINMPELGRYRAGAASIGLVSAQFWHIVA